MKQEFYSNNRKNLYQSMKAGSVLILFSGRLIHKTGDENFPFFTDRNFLYLNGLDEQGLILLAEKRTDGDVSETIYLHRPDKITERMRGIHIKAEAAQQSSGITQVRFEDSFLTDLNLLLYRKAYEVLYLDFSMTSGQIGCSGVKEFAAFLKDTYPYLNVESINPAIRALRTIKQPCEIEAIRKAEEITRDGIVAMMKASRPGLYEYQYKAEFDHALGQHGPQGCGFPSIISAGQNNFCIHYYDYSGQAKDGDMILNDVGAWYDGMITDVSRGFPCNGHFSDRQRLLYECAFATSSHMFEIIKPGMDMEAVDATIRSYNAEQMKQAGVIQNTEDIGTYMWHGGSHHLGWDVHDEVIRPEKIAPGMIFCVDVGIYHEEWGIGFRLEEDCLVTERGCENLSIRIPRTIAEIEQVME